MGIFDSVINAATEWVDAAGMNFKEKTPESVKRYSVKAGKSVKFELTPSWNDSSLDSRFYGEPLGDGKPFEKNIRVIIRRDKNQPSIFEALTLDGVRCGSVVTSDTQKAADIITSILNGLGKLNQYKRGEVELVFAARIKGEWISYDDEDPEDAEAEITSFSVRLDDPARIEVFEG